MLQVQLFFGQDRDGQPPIPAIEWQNFVETAASPRFPEGFTVFDADGQWLDPGTHKLTREKAKILQIVTPDTPEVRKKVEELSRLYRERFQQKAVGIVTNESCAAF